MLAARERLGIADHAALFGGLMTQTAEFRADSELTQRAARVKYQKTAATVQ